MSWTNLIPPGGTLIAPQETHHHERLVRMSDGHDYSARMLFEDRRNTTGLSVSTIYERLRRGERDPERILRRLPKANPPRKPTETSRRQFARRGMPL